MNLLTSPTVYKEQMIWKIDLFLLLKADSLTFSEFCALSMALHSQCDLLFLSGQWCPELTALCCFSGTVWSVSSGFIAMDSRGSLGRTYLKIFKRRPLKTMKQVCLRKQQMHLWSVCVCVELLFISSSYALTGQLYGLEKFWAFLKYSKTKNMEIDPKLQVHLSKFKRLEDFRVDVSRAFLLI